LAGGARRPLLSVITSLCTGWAKKRKRYQRLNHCEKLTCYSCYIGK